MLVWAITKPWSPILSLTPASWPLNPSSRRTRPRFGDLPSSVAVVVVSPNVCGRVGTPVIPLDFFGTQTVKRGRVTGRRSTVRGEETASHPSRLEHIHVPVAHIDLHR